MDMGGTCKTPYRHMIDTLDLSGSNAVWGITIPFRFREYIPTVVGMDVCVCHMVRQTAPPGPVAPAR